MIYLIVFLTSLILNIFLIPYLIEYLKNIQIVDHPGDRKIHRADIPRMGGIIIFGAAFFSLLGFGHLTGNVRFLLLGLITIFITGFTDDLINLRWNIKITMQSIAALFLIIFFHDQITSLSIFDIIIPSPLNYAVLMVFIVGVINSINLMDGMDGLVCGFSLFTFVIILVLAYTFQNTLLLVLSASLLGGILGFLKYNVHPARIFLGDTGSQVLGYFIVFSAMLITTEIGRQNFDLTFPILLLGVPIVDTLKVMIVRLRSNQNPFLPDKNHLHHIIFGNKVGYRLTVFLIQTFTLLFFVTALLYLKYDNIFIAVLSLALLSLILMKIKVIIKSVRESEVLINYYEFLRNFPNILIKFFKRYFLLFSTMNVFILLFFIFPRKTAIEYNILIPVSVSYLMFITISIYQYVKSKSIGDFEILINLFIFIALSNLSSPLMKNLIFSGELVDLIIKISSISLLVSISAFVITKDIMVEPNVIILSALDLVIIVLILLFTIIKELLGISLMEFWSANFLISFLVYLWFKIFSLLKNRYSKFLYYFSYALSVSTLLILLIK